MQTSFPMEYSFYLDIPDFFGVDTHHAPPQDDPNDYHPIVMKQVEPIVPNNNDILMGRGGKNHQYIGPSKPV